MLQPSTSPSTPSCVWKPSPAPCKLSALLFPCKAVGNVIHLTICVGYSAKIRLKSSSFLALPWAVSKNTCEHHLASFNTSLSAVAYSGIEVLEQRRLADLGAGWRRQPVVGLDSPDGPQHHLLPIFLKQALLEELIHMEAIAVQLLQVSEEGQTGQARSSPRA